MDSSRPRNRSLGRWWRYGLVAVLTLGVVVALTAGYHLQASRSQSGFTVTSMGPVSSTIIVMRVPPPPVHHAQQVPYRAQVGDRQEQIGPDLWVRRRGKLLGTLVGSDQAILFPLDQYEPPPDRVDRLDEPTRYTLQSVDDAQYQVPTPAIAVHRKSQPVDVAQVGEQANLWPLQHTLYVEWPHPLQSGRSYQVQIALPQGHRATVPIHYQPQSQLSEAVHVSQVGFRPDDPIKVGFLSTWMGTGGALTYPADLGFQVIDMQTNRPVWRGVAQLRHQAGEIEDRRDRTHTLTNVYALEFSALDRPGHYRLCVDGIGCSHAFDIDDAVWRSPFYTAMRGFYHQRSGLALEPPYTDFYRPRPFHPADGMRVYQSTTPLMDTGNGLNAQGTDPNNFQNLIQGKTTEIVPNAWGGYFDAGDWDRRIQHLDASRLLLDLLATFPAQYADFSLNIPESGNNLPDILDEVLWNVDFYRRLQTPTGGIRGGIESADHPKRGETSWQESLPVMAYAPDLWSSYVYAGVAARTAGALRQLGAADRAMVYQDSALAAMAYAEQEHQAGIQAEAEAIAVVDSDRALAALDLYRLTADAAWHEIFKTAFATVRQNSAANYKTYDTQDAIAHTYTQLPATLADATLQQDFRNQVIQQADQVLALGQLTAFGWTKTRPRIPIGWGGGLGAPRIRALAWADQLTGDPKYLAAAVLACQFSTGANPANMTFTTGVGVRSPQHPHTLDQRRMNQPPPPGITVFGPIDPVDYEDYWMFREFETVTTPPVRDWPTVETYFDVYTVTAINEFTIMQTLADTAYAWGYLNARSPLASAMSPVLPTATAPFG